MNVTLFRSVASVTDSGRQSSPDDTPAVVAEASGGRDSGDDDCSPEVPPRAASDDGACVGKEETACGSNNENSDDYCGKPSSATFTACDDNFRNVTMATKTLDMMTI